MPRTASSKAIWRTAMMQAVREDRRENAEASCWVGVGWGVDGLVGEAVGRGGGGALFILGGKGGEKGGWGGVVVLWGFFLEGSRVFLDVIFYVFFSFYFFFYFFFSALSTVSLIK